uniref:Guanylate-binding protein N-terminal domain-containing protein n=1 Tax=Globisporangium ultimum (strain ATCC 200006 / CBS 805.95 / DAOM BR144) TaxID=431595 RepID=K3W7D1_GLOUD
MDSLKSMLFGSKPVGRSAVKWLGMGPSDGRSNHTTSDHMFVSQEAATEVLQPLGDEQINLISIFGAARQGKSFLMNLLADQQDLFKISNLREPCTQGVDLSGHFIPLSTFSALNGCPQVATQNGKQIQIGFVDAEGQGDRDITYDSRLVSPVLLSSKTVIFNWKDSLQADRMLNLLAVLARAAQGVELADGDSNKVFGHLHIFVDSTPEQVYNDLFQKEKGRSEEVNVRNLARANLEDAFESIKIWLFPAPVANTSNLKDKIRFDQLQRPFQDKLRDLRKCLSSQLQTPMMFNRQPLTARLLSQIMPALVDTLNSDQVIMPESIYSSMVRAEAKVIKDECEKSISAYCEAAGVEEVMSSSKFEEILRKDIDFMISEAYEFMGSAPVSVRKEMKAALKEFANKEIRIALHANNEKLAERLSKEVDEIFATLKRECAVIEQSLIPMRSETLTKKCSELLNRELRRLDALPAGSQGKRGVEAEAQRIKQHASILFERLEVVNEKAIQKSNAIIVERVRNAKAEMTTDAHAIINKKFAVKRPVTIAALQAELEDIYLKLSRQIIKDAGVSSTLITTDYQGELESHKAHLAEELNRRYLVEMRQILNEVGYAGREDLQKEVAFRLDGKLPLPEGDIKAAIDAAIEQVKRSVAVQLQGWTVLKTDISARGAEIEKVGDVLTEEYLRRNADLEKEEYAKKVGQLYEELRAKLTEAFTREVTSAGFPTTEDKIESVFFKHLQTLVAKFLSFATGNSTYTPKSLRERLTQDCKPAIENQKQLNRLAIDKKQALEAAEKERQLREKESHAAQKKDAQISELKTYVEKSLGEKDSESKRLRDELRLQAEKARLLEQQVEEMKRKAEQAEAERKELECRAKEEQLREEKARNEESYRLKKQLEEMKIKATEMGNQKAALELRSQQEALKREEARQMKAQLEQMKLKAAAMEVEKHELELRALEEAAKREEAVHAARAAADAAALSARAALEAAAKEVTPIKIAVKDEAGSKRKLSNGDRLEHDHEDDDVDMEADSPPRSPGKSPPAERKKRRGPTKAKAKTTLDKGRKMTLAEARKAAQEEVERRIQARAKTLEASKKKH